MNYLIQTFIFALGGISRWIFCKLLNTFFNKDYPTKIDFYIDKNSNGIDKNGLNSNNKNFLIGILTIIVFIILLERIIH